MSTILLAEVDDNVTILVSTLLAARGHSVETRSDGKEAIELIRSQPFDLMIVGDQLSDIDGIGLIIKVRAINSQIPVVFISKTWREAAVYKRLTQDFKVSLVIHRPLKAGLFGAQIESIFASAEKSIQSHVEHEEAIINTLQGNYLKVLPERFAKIEIAIAQSKNNPDDAASLLEAIRLAHNLKGTAASCGFGVLGESASSLEKALDAIKENQLTHNEAAWEEIDLIANLVKGNAQSLTGDPVAQVDKRAFATIETPEEMNAPIPPPDSSIPYEPQDNFDTYDDSSSVRVLVFSSDVMPAHKRIGHKETGIPVQVIVSQTHEDALAKAGKLSLDAVLIDIDVTQPAPALNLARELRSLPGYETLPVAFLSTSQQQKYIEDSTHAGASLMLEKPLQTDIFNDAIEYLVNARQGGRPRILIVDDDDDFVKIVASALGQEGMLVRQLSDPTGLLQLIQEFHPDLVLLDVTVPILSGYDVCRMIRTAAHFQDLPILFLTGQTGLETRLAAFEAGGDDYLPKPIARVELLTRVKVRLERARMLKERSNKDILTGLLIRRAFMEQLNDMSEESKRNGLIFSLALIDVDHFKKINDKYGHLSGDRVLASFGQLLKKRFRVEDFRGRWGGEEFMVAFRHIQKETAQGALQRALEELRAMEFSGDHGETFGITFSAGLVSYPDDGSDIEDLIRKADERLYQAKNNGRNCLVAKD